MSKPENVNLEARCRECKAITMVPDTTVRFTCKCGATMIQAPYRVARVKAPTRPAPRAIRKGVGAMIQTYCIKCLATANHICTGSLRAGPYECARCGYRWIIQEGEAIPVSESAMEILSAIRRRDD